LNKSERKAIVNELYTCLTSELLLEQFDHRAIEFQNDTAKKKVLYKEFVNYIKSLHEPQNLEKILKFITGSIRIPLHRSKD
jgi:hypothetical protein